MPCARLLHDHSGHFNTSTADRVLVFSTGTHRTAERDYDRAVVEIKEERARGTTGGVVRAVAGTGVGQRQTAGHGGLHRRTNRGRRSRALPRPR